MKNIDNVTTDRLKADTYSYKKALAGYLLSLRETTRTYLKKLDNSCFDEALILDITDFAKNVLCLSIPSNWNELEMIEKVDYLYEKMNRPIRVCGMVKNEGEPGGGPFWIEKNGELSLQIVESSQIDMNNISQKAIFEKSSHFNPVDLVCCIKDFDGDAFELSEFVDNETGFISIKSKDGTDLKAQELPGLWNGAMADWITLFIEVPVSTFTPVKMVNDLLKEAHQ